MDLGLPEILVIVVIALLLFGPSKLPSLGKSMGEAIRGFKKGLKETTDDVEDSVRPSTRGPIVTPANPSRSEPPLISEPRNPTSTYTHVSQGVDSKIKNNPDDT